MSKKRMIIVMSTILSVVVISLGIIKLYQSYALSNDMVDANNIPTIDIYITENNAINVPANGYSNVFYMVNNTSPGTVNYGIGYSGTDVTVKVFSTSSDPASGLIEENGRKYVKLRIENSSSTSQSVVLSTVLGYSGDSNLLPPSGVTLVTEVYTPPPTLVNIITNLYTSASKSTVTNNNITYNTAPSVGLMNDRLGGTTADLDGGNIRYYGAEPNNYIYFNCSDYSNQSDSTCEKWRIIGVFDGKVKIMRESTIGSLAWDQDKNIDSSLTTYDNDWTTSSLQILLNQKYYNGDTAGMVKYYSGASGDTSTNLNMSSKGIKNNATRRLISDTIYYLGGWEVNSIYSDQIYGYERGTTVYTGRPTTWTGKIALPYLSDYGYAADLGSCTKKLQSYNDSTCTSVNWIYSILGTSKPWQLTPNSGSSSLAWYVGSSGGMSGNNTCAALGVVPVLYLNINIGIGLGSGTSSEPYRIIS